MRARSTDLGLRVVLAVDAHQHVLARAYVAAELFQSIRSGVQPRKWTAVRVDAAALGQPTHQSVTRFRRVTGLGQKGRQLLRYHYTAVLLPSTTQFSPFSVLGEGRDGTRGRAGESAGGALGRGPCVCFGISIDSLIFTPPSRPTGENNVGVPSHLHSSCRLFNLYLEKSTLFAHWRWWWWFHRERPKQTVQQCTEHAWN
jgi:hypothetical protein